MIKRTEQEKRMEKEFDSIENAEFARIKNFTVARFHNRLKEKGYLNEKGNFTMESELNFFQDRKIINITKRKKPKGKATSVSDFEYEMIPNRMQLHALWSDLIGRWRFWQGEEARRLEESQKRNTTTKLNGLQKSADALSESVTLSNGQIID